MKSQIRKAPRARRAERSAQLHSVPAPLPAAPALRLARVVEREGGGVRLQSGKETLLATVDAAIDPALIDEAIRSGARVVVEPNEAGSYVVAGVLTTHRTVEISRGGDVDADVRRWRVSASEEVLFKSSGSFLQLKHAEAELYASRILCRARDLTRLLGRMIKLN